MKFIFFSLALVMLAGVGFAQSLTGRVVDAASKEPVQFANVFFANTLIGTTTDTEGNFQLHDFGIGKYDLVVSFVGYQTLVWSLEYPDEREIKVRLEMAEDEIQLSDIMVNEDTTGARRNFKTFKENFLGRTRNAASAEILNPEVIHIYYDSKERVLYAHARQPIKVKNEALGYELSYVLSEFWIDYKNNEFVMLGIPHFSEIATDKKGLQERWAKARQRAYKGSTLHFFRVLQRDQLDKEGFDVRHVYQIPNPERPPADTIEHHLNAIRKEMRAHPEGSLSLSKKVEYWSRMKSLPVTLDSLGEQIVTGSEIKPHSQDLVEFTGVLEVKYLKEREEMGFSMITGNPPRKVQVSQITFRDPTLKIYSNGYYEDVKGIYIEQYWAWTSNIAELLPMEYQLPRD